MDQITYVLCVDYEDQHVADSKFVVCVKCNSPLWTSPHHIAEGRSPICKRCIPAMIKEEKPEFQMDIRDVVRALKEMR